VRSIGKFLGRLILIGLIVAAAVYFLPRETVERSGPVTADLSDPAAVLAAREAAFDDIRPGSEAWIVWAGAPYAPTDLVVVYLHGFSASRMETAPLAQEVAAALDANLLEMRLSGHGRDGDAMAEPRAGDWVDDAALAMALGRAIGDRVVLIGTSTGGTLATYAATEPDLAEGLAGIVLISPNFRLANPGQRGPVRGALQEDRRHRRETGDLQGSAGSRVRSSGRPAASCRKTTAMPRIGRYATRPRRRSRWRP